MATPGEPPRGPQYPGGLLGMPSDPLGLSGGAAAGRSSGPGMDVDPAHGIQLPELEREWALVKLTGADAGQTPKRYAFREVYVDRLTGAVAEREGGVRAETDYDWAVDPANVAAVGSVVVVVRDPARTWLVVGGGGGGPVLKGVMDQTLTFGGSALVSVWRSIGSADVDTGDNVIAWCWVLKPGQTVPAGARVDVAWDLSSVRYEVIAAWCP